MSRITGVDLGTGPRVLVVDDDASSRSGVAKLLAIDGYVVETADDAVAALARAAAHAPDIVVTDLMMPGMDGVELLRKLHERDPDLPVIVATAAWGLAPAVRAVCAGAYDYIAKPIDFDTLTGMIERALERRRHVHRARVAASSVVTPASVRPRSD